MADQSAFDSNNSQGTPAPVPDNSNPFANQLGLIKNDTGAQKYDTVEKALEALNHSQEFIPQLKTQVEEHEVTIAALNEKLAAAAAVEDVVARLRDQAPATPPGQEPQTPTPGLSEEAVLKIVQGFSADQTAAQASATNEATVSQSLFKLYGDKTSDVVASKAAELGTTVEALKTLSQQSPAVVLGLFQVPAATTSITSSSSMAPPQGTPQEGLQPPEKSLMRGASDRERAAYMRKIKEDVYKKFDVKT